MVRNLTRLLTIIAVIHGPAGIAAADGGETDRLVQSTTEARTYIHFKIPGAAVQKALPDDWVSSPATGPLAGTNLIMLLVEGLAAHSPEGNPVLHQGKFALWAVPAKSARTGAAAFMILGGLTSQTQAAPGAYGVYAFAHMTMIKSARSEGPNVTFVEENWTASSDAGDRISFAAAYQRGVGTRAYVEPHAYSATRPDFYRIYRADQITDTVHSTAAGMRKATKVEFSASGPQLSKFFNGSEELLGITSIPAYDRKIFLPD